MAAGSAIRWSDQMIDFLKENHSELSNQELADALGLKITAVRHKCYELGLYKMKLEYWTADQITFLKENFQKKGDLELAQIFNEKWEKEKGWTKKHIEKKRKYLSLKRSEEEKEAIKENHKLKGVFIRGSQKTWATRGVFPEGTIRIWGNDKMIKTENGYQHLRVYNYRKLVGEIPKGMMVRHKDGNTLNCDAENLFLISRQEHAMLNVYNSYGKYPEELRLQMRKLRKLNRIIKKLSHE